MTAKKTSYRQLTSWTLGQFLKGRAVSAVELQSFGQPPRAIINQLRHVDRVPVRTKRRLNASPNPTEHRSTSWDMLPAEIVRYESDRMNQVADMIHQADQRQHRNECRRAKHLLEKMGLEVPEQIEAGAALFVANIAEGKAK